VNARSRSASSVPGLGRWACWPSGKGAQPQDRVPGAAQAVGGCPGAPGCPGQVAELAGQAVWADVGAQVAVPVVDEAGGVVGVGVHGFVLSVRPGRGSAVAGPTVPAGRGRDRTCGPTGNSHSTRKGRCTGPAATSRRLRSATSRPWNRPAPLPAPRPRPTHWPTWAAAPWARRPHR